jgi:hypothetical protein
MGLGLLWPLTNGLRYDLVFDVRGRLYRVQCKTARQHGNVVVIRCRTCRRTASGYERRSYTTDDVDLIAAYCVELSRSFALPPHLFAGRTAVQLRLAPTKNNQREGINWEEDFEFAATIRRLGAVAQLGERESGTLEVTGSIPVGSTRSVVPPPSLW